MLRGYSSETGTTYMLLGTPTKEQLLGVEGEF